MKLVGAIIAGGRGLRLGGCKPLSPFLASTLLDAVIERVRPQVQQLGVNARQEDFSRLRAHLGDTLPLFADSEEGDIGPLAGVLASLDWAGRCGATWLATFPSDTPFLPQDLVKQLLAQTGGISPAAAHDGSRLHGLCAVWPVPSYARLLAAVRGQNLRSLHQAVAHLGASECVIDCPQYSFFNVNTPEDLALAERIAHDVT